MARGVLNLVYPQIVFLYHLFLVINIICMEAMAVRWMPLILMVQIMCAVKYLDLCENAYREVYIPSPRETVVSLGLKSMVDVASFIIHSVSFYSKTTNRAINPDESWLSKGDQIWIMVVLSLFVFFDVYAGLQIGSFSKIITDMNSKKIMQKSAGSTALTPHMLNRLSHLPSLESLESNYPMDVMPEEEEEKEEEEVVSEVKEKKPVAKKKKGGRKSSSDAS